VHIFWDTKKKERGDFNSHFLDSFLYVHKIKD